jgi:secernin
MCDTILAPPRSTATGAMLFGKNSDRRRNEAQAVEVHPRAEHPPGATVRCTYITIPQVPRTHAVLLCRPFWMWGAEMGANDHGVVIGNEGLHARTPAPREEALLGMDLLRLTLERAGTATEAVEVLTTLLSEHGQGGNCGHLIPSYYHNGFMIADARQAFVVETVGREWLVEEVSAIRTISNRYSIAGEPQRTSTGLATLVGRWSRGTARQSYAEVLPDPQKEHIESAASRQACSTSLLRSMDGKLAVADMFNVLRNHGLSQHFELDWQARYLVDQGICMHAGAADCPAQTVGSMASELHEGRAVHWLTGTAAPCISIFKPVVLGVPFAAPSPALTDRFDRGTLWWRHEQLHRAALLGDFGRFMQTIRPERDELEAQFAVRIAEAMNGGSTSDVARVVTECWQAASDMEKRWYAGIHTGESAQEAAYVAEWERMNDLAGVRR